MILAEYDDSVEALLLDGPHDFKVNGPIVPSLCPWANHEIQA